MKKCGKCEKIKPESEFYSDRARHDGLQTYCKTCEKIWKRNNRAGNPKYKKRMSEYHKKRNRSVHGKYLAYIHMAKQRKHSFELSEIEFSLFVSSPCYYCGNVQEHFNGIDRVNNEGGYIIKNCVPCCETCNKMKLIKTKEDFIMKCKEVVEKEKVMTYCK